MQQFGTTVLYKVGTKVEGGVMEPRWEVGTWLGKRFSSEEHIVAGESGNVMRSPFVKPHPTEQWNWERFSSIKGTPWDPYGKEEGEESGDVRETMQDIPKAFQQQVHP